MDNQHKMGTQQNTTNISDVINVSKTQTPNTNEQQKNKTKRRRHTAPIPCAFVVEKQ